MCVLALVAGDGMAQQDRPEIARSIASLGDKDPAVRWASVLALTKFGAESVPPLSHALADQSENVRANAALALGRIGAPAIASLPNLVAALKDSSPLVREKAAEALGEMGPDAARGIEALVLCLSDRNPFVRGMSAEALGRIGRNAVPALMGTLSDGIAPARWSAAIALGKLGPEAYPAVALLTRALSDSSDEVRWGAAVALGNIGRGAESAVPALTGALSDRDQDVRGGASLALDKIDPSAVESNRDWKSVAGTIDALVPRLMEETHVPGVAVALISDRTLVWSGRYGVADVSARTPVTEETMFEACSMTKPVFCYLAMMLLEQQKLDLDRPLVDYLDPSDLRGQPMHTQITARMVLSHTSGLPNWRKGEEETDGPIPVLFKPGSRFGYSGEGFTYLQRVVERITGEPLDLYAGRTLFHPLGLENTSLVWTEDLDGKIAAGHNPDGASLGKSRYTHPNAAYTLYTSASDYARFIIEVMDPARSAPPLLTQRSIDTMLTPQVVVASREPIERPGRGKGSEVYWGLGWSINAAPQGRIVHHSGSNRSGFRCFSQFCPATGSGLAIMTNGAGGSDLWVRLINRIGNL